MNNRSLFACVGEPVKNRNKAQQNILKSELVMLPVVIESVPYLLELGGASQHS